MRYFYPERMERWSGASFTQLLPRKFMSDLPEERHREFLDLLKSQRGTFRESRADMRDVALRFAEALERNPYDEARSPPPSRISPSYRNRMVDSGTLVTLQIVQKLTPEERILLAQHVRDRVERMQNRRGKKPDDQPDGG